jgi:hypothetical protein
METPATQILWIFAVRTRRHLFASRPHRAVAGLAFGAAALTIALPFLPGISRWFEFVHPPAIYFPFLLAVIAAFVVTTELVKRLFYAHMAQNTDPLAIDQKPIPPSAVIGQAAVADRRSRVAAAPWPHVAYLTRNRKFESIPLQQRVRLSPDFARVPDKARVFRQFGDDAGRHGWRSGGR